MSSMSAIWVVLGWFYMVTCVTDGIMWVSSTEQQIINAHIIDHCLPTLGRATVESLSTQHDGSSLVWARGV